MKRRKLIDCHTKYAWEKTGVILVSVCRASVVFTYTGHFRHECGHNRAGQLKELASG